MQYKVTFKINSTDTLKDVTWDTAKKLGDIKFTDYEVKKVVETRTSQQNRAFHKWLTMLAEELNARDYTQDKLLNEIKFKVEIPVTPTQIKDIFRAAAQAMFQVESTADLTTVQIQQVYDAVDKRFAETTGITVAWPSEKPPLI